MYNHVSSVDPHMFGETEKPMPQHVTKNIKNLLPWHRGATSRAVVKAKPQLQVMHIRILSVMIFLEPWKF